MGPERTPSPSAPSSIAEQQKIVTTDRRSARDSRFAGDSMKGNDPMTKPIATLITVSIFVCGLLAGGCGDKELAANAPPVHSEAFKAKMSGMSKKSTARLPNQP